jgi:MFS transporter, PPP family, 3-phenylpropionic acid transporter
MKNNKPLMAVKAFYFCYYAAWACLVPFLALYYQSLGFSGSQIGFLASISPLVVLFAAPFWAGAADASSRHKLILLLCIAGAAVGVMFIPRAPSFAVLIPVVVMYAFYSAPIIPLVDHSVMSLLTGRQDQYGRQRLWGAVGWGVSAPAAGWLVGQFGLLLAFPSYLFFAVLSWLTALRLAVAAPQRSTPYKQSLGKLLSNPRWILFLMVVFTGASGLAVVSNFLFLYLAELGTPTVLMGLSLTIATISELPVLFYSGGMLRRWGPRGVLILSLAALIVRTFGYSISSQPWQALLFQLLHGLSFSAMWVAGVSFAAVIAPPGLGATAQGVFSSTVMGLGAMTGALAGGLLYDQFGGAGMFRITSIAVLACLLLLIAAGKRLAQSAGPAA